MLTPANKKRASKFGAMLGQKGAEFGFGKFQDEVDLGPFDSLVDRKSKRHNREKPATRSTKRICSKEPEKTRTNVCCFVSASGEFQEIETRPTRQLQTETIQIIHLISQFEQSSITLCLFLR